MNLQYLWKDVSLCNIGQFPLFSDGSFAGGGLGGQSFRSTRYSLQAKVQRPRAPWIFLICLPYTLHSKMNMEPKKWTFGRWFFPFSNPVIFRFYAYFQECLESSVPNTKQQKTHRRCIWQAAHASHHALPHKLAPGISVKFHLYIHHAQKPKQVLWWQNWRHLKSETPIDFNQKSVQRSLNRIFWSLFFKQLQCSWVAAIH